MFPIKLLCEMIGIQRSSFYNWKAHLSKPSEREKALVAAIMLFKEYHLKYPSHGYRWLNAKIFLDTGKKMSDPYAHKKSWFPALTLPRTTTSFLLTRGADHQSQSPSLRRG